MSRLFSEESCFLGVVFFQPLDELHNLQVVLYESSIVWLVEAQATALSSRFLRLKGLDCLWRLGRIVFGRLLFATQIIVLAERLCLKMNFRPIAQQPRQSSIASTSLRSALACCRSSSHIVGSSMVEAL